MATFARLSALDRLFLDIEDRTVHMHVGGTCIFDSEPLETAQGGVNGDLIREYIESRLHLMPRFRQRLALTPIEGHPIWVDDDSFNIRYHVRHASLPRPGTPRQLKRLVGWINSQQLDRGKPLWEMWVIEGLEGGGFALVNKTHHAMIDGISGADLMPVLLSPDPSVRPAAPHRWYPQRLPASPAILLDAACHRASAPLRFATKAAGKLLRDPRGSAEKLAGSLLALGQTIAMSAKPAMDTPLNRAIGSQRRFDWLALDLTEVKDVKNRLGGTVNDVVLSCVAGALGRFLTLRGLPFHTQKTGPFRAFCPVNIRASQDHGTMGNHVSNVLAVLPITESDPVRRLHEVSRVMKEVKSSGQARGTELVEKIAEWTTPRLLSGMVRLAANSHPYNLIVTNVPGPQFPLYLLGARMREMYPLVPLFSDQGLGIALFSYAGKIYWGFNADRDLVPDLHDFVHAVEESFAELHSAALQRDVRHLDLEAHVATESQVESQAERRGTALSH
jgi:WS/DGAT/MGAT family acyltransferase